MHPTATPFVALLPRLLRLDPLVRVYLTDDEVLAFRIGNQFSNLDSPKILSQICDADERAANPRAIPALEQLAMFHLKRREIVAITVEHRRSFHRPDSLATVRIQLASGKETRLLLLPDTNVTAIIDLITTFYPSTMTTGKPREVVSKIKRSPDTEARQQLFLGCFFACHAAVFLWFSLQQLAHLPILLAVPLNIWGAVHCFRKRLKKNAVDRGNRNEQVTEP